VCGKEWPAGLEACPEDGIALEGATAELARSAAATADARGRADIVAVPAEPPEELTPGTMVGDYQIVEKIGQGGMGTVYGAKHPLIHKRAAIKVISRELSHSASAIERFVREARAVNQIGHPNIVDIFAFGTLPDGRPYLAMEWLTGQSLADRLALRPLELRESVAVLEQICRALEAAHAKGIVHRDLKPDNVFLVDVPGDRPLVKLLDFGIAKLRAEEGGVKVTRDGVMVGTPMYVSPEQARGVQVDQRTDIYSLAVVAYEMLCGRPPFVAGSASEIVAMHLDRTPPRPSKLWREVPPALEWILLKMLAKDPAARASLAQFAAALAQMRGEPTDPRIKLPSRWTKPALTAMLALAIVSGGAYAVVRFSRGKTAAHALPATSSTVALQVITDPPGATVTIDGSRQTLLSPNTFRVARKRELVVAVELEKYRANRRSVTFADDESEKAIRIELAPIATPTGRLSVRVNAKTARYLIDDKPVGDGSGVLIIEDLAAGVHHLAVESRGLEPRKETIEIKPNALTELTWELPAYHQAKAVKPTKPTPPIVTPAKTSDRNAVPDWPPK
jgi:serine/threonine protein kinase